MEKYNYYLDINFKDRTSEVEALYEPTLKDIKADPEMYAELVNDLLFHWVYGTRETPLMVMVKKQMQGDTKMADGGVMAMGGILEHGLKIGDEIIDVSDINSSSIRVMNDGKYAYVNLSTGVRKEAMALGGLFGDSRYNYGRSWTLDHRQHNKEESYETPLKNRKRKYYDGGDIDIYGNKVEFPLSNHQMKNYVIDKTGISSGTYINGKYYDTWDKIATDLGFMREENGWVKAFPSRIYTRKRKY